MTVGIVPLTVEREDFEKLRAVVVYARPSASGVPGMALETADMPTTCVSCGRELDHQPMSPRTVARDPAGGILLCAQCDPKYPFYLIVANNEEGEYWLNAQIGPQIRYYRFSRAEIGGAYVRITGVMTRDSRGWIEVADREIRLDQILEVGEGE